jgi:hypothetical protein
MLSFLDSGNKDDRDFSMNTSGLSFLLVVTCFANSWNGWRIIFLTESFFLLKRQILRKSKAFFISPVDSQA